MAPDATDPTESAPPITDPGVTVAEGDPDSISAAGDFHSDVADKLESHSSLIKSTASVLLKGWNGQASKQYQDYSNELAGHYEVTAAEARSVAEALKKFSSELDDAQGEGRVALKNAIHWMNEVNRWNNKLSDALDDQTKAESAIKKATTAVSTAQTAANAAHPTAEAAADLAAANQQLHDARNQLTQAETDISSAKVAIKNSSAEFTRWQKKGGDALQKAEESAGVAGLALGVVTISNPPLSSDVDSVLGGVSGSTSETIFEGLGASAGGGPSGANWNGLIELGAGETASASGSAGWGELQGDANFNGFIGEQGLVNGNLGWSQFGGSGTLEETTGLSATGDANGTLSLSGLQAGAGGGVLAGGSATASGGANVGPASASGSAGVSYGAGANVGGSIDASAGKVGISWNAGVTLGVGINLSGSISVDPAKTISDVGHGISDLGHLVGL